jgi:lactate dehydrogenase-like 2-hydroxyacid dehydrogenase
MTDRPTLLIYDTLNARLTSLLKERFETITIAKHGDSALLTEKDVSRIRGIASDGKVTAAMIAALPKLEIIANLGVGIDGIDLEAARKHNVIVTNTPSVLTDAVADTALLLLLAVTRNAIEADRFVRAGYWPKGKLPLASGLTGKLCGIVGMGRIGQGIARRAEAFGMQIAWTGPHAKPEIPYRYVPEIKDLAMESHALILALPGGQATQNTVDADVLAALGPQGYLVNIARGSVVDEPALLAALRGGTIAGAGLDVFYNEPDIDPAFAGLKNTVLFPHMGSATVETRNAMTDLVMENLTRHFAGQPVVTPVT